MCLLLVRTHIRVLTLRFMCMSPCKPRLPSLLHAHSFGNGCSLYTIDFNQGTLNGIGAPGSGLDVGFGGTCARFVAIRLTTPVPRLPLTIMISSPSMLLISAHSISLRLSRAATGNFTTTAVATTRQPDDPTTPTTTTTTTSFGSAVNPEQCYDYSVPVPSTMLNKRRRNDDGRRRRGFAREGVCDMC